MRPEDAREKIRTVMADLKPHRLDGYTIKTKQLKFRLHDEEFEEIRDTAERLGLSIAEYFCTLHRYAKLSLSNDSDGATWVHPVRKPRQD